MYKRRMAERAYRSLREPNSYKVGSEAWLQATEKHFGGYVEGVQRTKVSEHDPRLAACLHMGGDRMFHHAYAAAYARHLERFLPQRGKRIAIAEIGILKGTGLALWSELFPSARVIGLDIDPSNFRDNEAYLRSKGAFATGTIEAHEFDQFLDNREQLASILEDDKISVIIDDGHHSVESIVSTARSATPFLTDAFVYFIEDNASVSDLLREQFPDCRVSSYGELTVIER